jgi:hypothetical protein
VVTVAVVAAAVAAAAGCREHGSAEGRKQQCDGLRDGHPAVWNYPSNKNANRKTNIAISSEN